MTSRPPSPPSTDIEFAGSLAAIGDAGDWLEAWLAPRAVPAELAFAMRLCLEEALANVVMHGGKGGGKEGAAISASLAEKPGAFILRISDDGAAFDPVSAESPKEAQIGGNGLILLRRYTSAMSYRRTGRRNRLTLTFNLPDGTPAPDR